MVVEEFAELPDDDGVRRRPDEGADAPEAGGVGDAKQGGELEVRRRLAAGGGGRLRLGVVGAHHRRHLADQPDGDGNHHRRRRGVRDDHREDGGGDHEREDESSRRGADGQEDVVGDPAVDAVDAERLRQHEPREQEEDHGVGEAGHGVAEVGDDAEGGEEDGYRERGQGEGYRTREPEERGEDGDTEGVAGRR